MVLAKVGHLQLLEQLPGELLLPVPVAMEIQSGDPAPTRPGKPWRVAGASESLPAAFPLNS
jgi:predicted nucleic acid-binding protein